MGWWDKRLQDRTLERFPLCCVLTGQVFPWFVQLQLKDRLLCVIITACAIKGKTRGKNSLHLQMDRLALQTLENGKRASLNVRQCLQKPLPPPSPALPPHPSPSSLLSLSFLRGLGLCTLTMTGHVTSAGVSPVLGCVQLSFGREEKGSCMLEQAVPLLFAK